MKVYYLKFNKSDLTQSGYTWTSPVIDLYTNSQYKNYSTTKSGLGLDSLGDRTWTGLNDLGNGYTDYGYIEGGRFIDTTATVDIVNWSVTYDADIDEEIPCTLAIYNADHSDNTYLGDWAVRSNISQFLPTGIYQADRYAFFELTFTPSMTATFTEIELALRVEIDTPSIWSYFSETKAIQNKFPEWMDIREYDPTDLMKENKATPDSIGGALINAIAGEWLTDIHSQITYAQYQGLIDVVDTAQKDWVYKVSNTPIRIFSVTGDGTQLSQAGSLRDFYDAGATEDVFLWNERERSVYCVKDYTTLLINDTEYTLTPYHTWNALDDIGLSVDMYRMRLETNTSFKARIKDVYLNRPGISLDRFKLAIRRELNLWQYYGSTPDSAFQGATPEVLEISDIEKSADFFDEQGNPKPKFLELAKELARKSPVTWGYLRYGAAFWDIDGTEDKGYTTIPRQFDATPVSEGYIESGVGDFNDLYMYKPDEYTGAQEAGFKFKVRGRQRTSRTEYPKLTFDVKVYGVADWWFYETPSDDFNFTMEFVSGGVTYYHPFTLTGHSDTSYWSATPTYNSLVLYDILNDSLDTDFNMPLYNKTSGEELTTQLSYDDITSVTIKPGTYDVGTGTYLDAPTQADYTLWFSDDETAKLGATGSAVSIAISTFNTTSRAPIVAFRSLQSSGGSFTTDSWTSRSSTYTISINGLAPDVTTSNFTLALPEIAWPSSTLASSRKYVVELLTKRSGVYGAYTSGVPSGATFIPSSYLYVDGSNSWTSGVIRVDDSASSIIFSSGSGGAYPITAETWASFEAQTSTRTIYVDENGPYRNGVSGLYGDASYLADYYNLTRDDFGIPNTTDYIVTWLGIGDTTNSNILVWTDVNTVNPIIDEFNGTAPLTYPDNSIEEELDVGVYEYNSVVVRAKYKPGVNEKWNPKLNSGWFYDDIDEYYLYANKRAESATTNYKTLAGVNYQGAPLIVRGIKDTSATPLFEMRQVTFFDPATPQLNISNTETVYGTGSNRLYVSYPDIYSISVRDATANQTKTVTDTSSTTNIVTLSTTTSIDHEYEVTYKLKKSFYVDNDYTIADRTRRAYVYFDATPGHYGVNSYEINYEGSQYDYATPVSVPLNPLYTAVDEGFVYIDHDIYTINNVDVVINPISLAADPYDYALVSIFTYDENNNPKPYQTVNLYTNFGVISNATPVTDENGFASTILASSAWNGGLTRSPYLSALGSATPNQGGGVGAKLRAVTGSITADTEFSVMTSATPTYTILAAPSAVEIPADGISQVYIMGRVQDASLNPVANADVYWKKNRYMYDLFRDSTSTSAATPGRSNNKGKVSTDSYGRFTIGPFQAATPSDPGIWFVSTEAVARGAAQVGDVVYWNEYEDTTSNGDDSIEIAGNTAQMATPWYSLPEYFATPVFPVTYDEHYYQEGKRSSNVVTWTPPRWYAVSRFLQYNMGILGSNYLSYNQGATPNVYPDYKEI